MQTATFTRNNLLFVVASATLSLLLTGCGGTEGQRLMQEGASPAYAQGYDDGCSSGKKAAGNMFAQFHKNVQNYQDNADYRMGWNDGHEECRSEEISSMQQQKLATEQQRALDEHKWTEQLSDQNMARDAMPALTSGEIDDLNKLGQ